MSDVNYAAGPAPAAALAAAPLAQPAPAPAAVAIAAAEPVAAPADPLAPLFPGMAGDPAKAPTLQQLEAVAIAEAKSFVRSRTLWALVVAGVGSWLQRAYGHDISPADQVGFVNDALGFVQYGGLAAAGIFRVLATRSLK